MAQSCFVGRGRQHSREIQLLDLMSEMPGQPEAAVISHGPVNLPRSPSSLSSLTTKMLSRAAARALPRASTLSARTSAVRTISTTARACSDGHPVVPKIYGPGSKPGEMPSLLDQATGLERLQLLGDIEGFEAFDRSPLDASRIGTKKEPIVVLSHVSGQHVL